MYLSRFHEAIEDFSAILAAEPDSIHSLRHRATAYLRLGRQEQAVRDYDGIIRLEPDDPSVHQQGQAALEQVEEAEES